jgi:tryptophan halogenase
LLEGGAHDAAVRETNDRIGAHWDFLRWFLAIHYKFNRKLDTEFWRSCRELVDASGMAALIAHFQEHGPWRSADEIGSLVDDPTFGENAILTLLLGQKVDAPRVPSRYSSAGWAARMGDQRAIVARAYSQADALALLQRRPDLLQEYAGSPSSWCADEMASMFGVERTPS